MMGVVRGYVLGIYLKRLSIKVCVSCVWRCIPWIAIRKVFSSALRKFYRPRSLSAIQRLSVGQYTPKLVVLPMPFLSGGGGGK
jgi:hypothetical protein